MRAGRSLKRSIGYEWRRLFPLLASPLVRPHPTVGVVDVSPFDWTLCSGTDALANSHDRWRLEFETPTGGLYKGGPEGAPPHPSPSYCFPTYFLASLCALLAFIAFAL